MPKSFLSKTSKYLILAMIFLVATHHASARTAIIDKGKANATIYLSVKAPDTVVRAADDLQSYLKQVTDVEVPITSDATGLQGFVIYLGDTEMARQQGVQTDKLPPDGFQIIANSKWMVIAGKDYDGPVMTGFDNPFRLNESYNSKVKMGAFGDAGTLFGVYHFLEQYCGVRWYMPGPLGTVIQPKKKITVPSLNISKSPFYPQRHAYYGFLERSEDDTLWYRRAGYGSPAPVQVMHSFGPFFYKYKDSHPEYFAIIDGQPDFTNRSTAETQGNLNLSHPGLIQQAIDDANKYFDDNPEQTIFPLCPPDGMTKISEDPISQAQIDKSQGPGGEFSNYVWGFINKVAKGIQQKHPDKFIGGFAYERYSKPPTNIEKLESNVVLVITKFRGRYPDPAIKQATEERIAAWAKKVKVIYTWEYYCNSLFNAAWKGFPMSFPKLIQDDLKSLKGVSRGEFIEAESWAYANNQADDLRIKYPGMQHLLLYTTARLLWNPDMDLNAMLTEYYKLFYGPAEVPMRGFWEKVESNWYQKSWQMNPYQVYDSTTIRQLIDYLEQAEDKTAPNSIYRQRIELIKNEFAPAAQIAIKQETLPRPEANVPALETPPIVATGASLPPLLAAPPIQAFLDRNFNDASPVTNGQVAWDRRNLYIDLRCYEPAMDKLKTLATKRDSSLPPIEDDDCVEIVISPDLAQPKKTFHYIVNARGTLYDARTLQSGSPEDSSWNGNAEVAVRKEANRWIARLAIPWSDLGVGEPKAGYKLMANFCRTRHAAGEYSESAWAPLRSAAYNSPEDFGILTLQDEAVKAMPPTGTVIIAPASNKDFGSGASSADIYYDGGIPGTGLFVGQGNSQVRNDRVLCKFNLAPLLEEGQKLKKVELVFGVHYVTGKKLERSLNVNYYPYTVGTLNAQVLATDDTLPVAVVKVTPADSFQAAGTDKTAFVSRRVDVTALIRDTIAKGHSSVTFRWQDNEAEKAGNPDGVATGMVLSDEGTGGIPSLAITMQ